MKVIDLLNKIANGEIDSSVKFSTMYDYCDIEGYTHRYILNENTLNEEIKTIDEWVEDISKEEKKAPEKIELEPLDLKDDLQRQIEVVHYENVMISNTINKLIDYLKSKGE